MNVVRVRPRLIGARLPRFEDERFLRGEGLFVADAFVPGVAHAVILRSQVACGVLRKIDGAPALACDGAIAVLTGADAMADGLGGIPWEVCPPGFETRAKFQGDPDVAAPQPVLVRDHVRYVGEPLAMAIAETLSAAQDMAERILVEIEATTPVSGLPRDALSDWGAPDGAVFSAAVGDLSRAEAALRDAAHVVELNTFIPRLAAAPMETRGYLAAYDEAEQDWTVMAAAGKPHPVRDTIARHVLHVEPARIRVVAPDVGGGFGAKNVAHAEMALVLWAARRLARPVRWICTRTDAFLSDMQGRGHAIHARLGVGADGELLALTYRALADLGAYLGPRAVVPATSGLKVLNGPYKIGAVAGRVDALHTNTVPTCPYRGAGIPETAFVVERLIDMAARRIGVDPVEMRACNLVSAADLPYDTGLGTRLHSVDFQGLFAIARRGWRQFEPPVRAGRLRGRGMAFTIEAYGVSFDEAAELVAHGDGRIEIRIGTKSSGQSHETAYAQIAAASLGVAPETFVIVQGDTALIERGNGTGASRSMTTGGSAVLRAAEELVTQAREHAAGLLQCAPEALAYEDGAFTTPGPAGARVDLAEVARSLPGEQLHVTASFRPSDFSFPHGCHIAVVDVDPETGEVELVGYRALQDAGVAINSMVAEAQLAGGIAQGIGAALMEHLLVDPDTAQPLTASLLDYAVPRGLDLSRIEVELRGVPCASNPLGAKAIGEAGTVAAPPAVINAIVDALAPLGVTHIDLPATPQRIWDALRQAKKHAQEHKRKEQANGGGEAEDQSSGREGR